MLLQGADILAENNTLERLTHNAVHLTTSVSWGEAIAPANVIVRGSTIDTVGASVNAGYLGAISAVTDLNGEGQAPDAKIMRVIDINSNTLTNLMNPGAIPIYLDKSVGENSLRDNSP
jgi:hypothetical protein